MSPSKRAADAQLQRHLKKALPVAVDAALEAGAFLKRKFGKLKHVTEKPDTSLVSEADKGSERLVLKRLRAAYPNDVIVAEETGLNEVKYSSAFRWHVDPLDGTTNFVHGFPFFCVSIGVEFELRDLVLGVLYAPITGDLYTGYFGGGAFRNRKAIHVSKTAKLSHSLLSTGFSMRKENYFEREIAAFARITHGSHAVRRTGSAALDLIHVATGQFDGFWERGLATWDTAAGLAVLSEAGGTFSRMDGKPFRLGDDSVLASNGKIHRELVRVANF